MKTPLAEGKPWEHGNDIYNVTYGPHRRRKGTQAVKKPFYLTVLSRKQMVFVEVYVQSGSLVAACRAAGYSDTAGYQLMQNPRVADAVRQYTTHCLKNYGPIAIQVLLKMTEDDTIPHQYRMAAAKELLDRSMGKAAQQLEVDVKITDQVKESELLARIVELQKTLQLEKGPVMKTIEGEATEISQLGFTDEPPPGYMEDDALHVKPTRRSLGPRKQYNFAR